MYYNFFSSTTFSLEFIIISFSFFHLVGFAWIYDWFTSKLLLEKSLSVQKVSSNLLFWCPPSFWCSSDWLFSGSAVQRSSWILPTVSFWGWSRPLPSVGSSFSWIPCFPLCVYFLILLEHILWEITARVQKKQIFWRLPGPKLFLLCHHTWLLIILDIVVFTEFWKV